MTNPGEDVVKDHVHRSTGKLQAEIPLHSDAVCRFSELAEAVRRSLGPALPPQPVLPLVGSHAHVPIRHEIKLGVDTGESPWIEGTVDPTTGRYVHLEIHSPCFHLAISQSGMQAFTQLVDQVAGHKDLRDLCSAEYVESCLIAWLPQEQLGSQHRLWGDVLSENLRRDVALRRILVPLEGLAIDREFSIGSVRFGFFTSDYLERMYAQVQSRGAAEQDFQLLRKKYDRYQGVVYACYECVAEPSRAKERALQEVEDVLALLRFFYPGALDVRSHCPVGRMGFLARHHAHFFLERDGDVDRISHEARRWGIDMDLTRGELERLMSDGLGTVDALLRAADRTDLQGRVLDAIALFSAGLLSPAIEHRLIHALVAMESLFLKTNTEPVMGSLAPRVAHVAGKTVEERRAIVSDLRQVYGLRSNFVHHGRPVAPEAIDIVNRAVMHSWVALLSLLGEIRWKAKEEMIQALDNRMLA